MPKNLSRLNRYEGDPIFIDENQKYWFTDETWTEMYGPFETLEECSENLADYVTALKEG